MCREYDEALDLCTIREVINRCRHDLQGSAPVGALPELTERLARQRLAAMADRIRAPADNFPTDVRRFRQSGHPPPKG